MVGARLPNADLRGAVFQRVDLTSVDLSRAHLEDVDLSTCALTGALLADAWLDRTNISPAQLVIVGEELRCDWESAARAYRSLERNFESLGESDAASRAYRRRGSSVVEEAMAVLADCLFGLEPSRADAARLMKVTFPPSSIP